MKKCIPFILLTLSFSMQSFGMDVVYMGGGGEPEGDKTIFDSALNKFADAKIRINANVQMSFNGGHAETNAIIENRIQVPHTPFTKENYKNLVDASLLKITSGQIPRGGQLMVVVDTHGGEREMPSETHSIALSGATLVNTSQVRGEKSDSIDRLKALADAALKNGVKLAIVDLSCHSGNSLPLGNSSTCVVSSTGPNHFGYGTFGEAFFDKIQPGRSLEDVYLKARADSYDHGFPMISSPVGKKINEKLYSLFTPYINYRHDDKTDKLTGYIGLVARCEARDKRDADFQKLLVEIDAFERIAGVAKSKYAGEEVLKDELIDYKRMQDGLLDELKNLNYAMLIKKEKIVYPAPDTKEKFDTEVLSFEEVLRYPAGNLSYFEDILKSKTKKSKTEILDTTKNINKIKAVLKRKEELNAQYPDLKKTTAAVFKKIELQSSLIMEKARKVSGLARRVYEQSYQTEKSSNREPNPCADFKF